MNANFVEKDEEDPAMSPDIEPEQYKMDTWTRNKMKYIQ
jgi:hypothetical protein